MAAPVAKGDELELDVESLAFGGNGVARHGGFVVFVRRGLPGDRVRARVTKVKRSHAEALATEILSPGEDRVDAPCPHFPACGGCRFQDLAYDAQLAQKGRRCATRSCASPASPSRRSSRSSRASRRSSTTATSSSTRSRRRTEGPRSASTAPAAGTRCSTSASAGSSTSSGTRSATPCASGRARKGSRRTRRRTAAAISATSSCGRAATRGRRSFSSSPRRARSSSRGYFVDVLRRFPEVRSVHWAVNDTPAEVTNLPTRLLWGEEWIEEELCGLRFRVRPNAFLQTNTAMAERLYGLARDAAGLTGSETVWDLYCGIGTIGLSLAADALTVWGIEVSEESVACALENAELNGDHELGVLRRQRRRGRRGAARALRLARGRRRRPAARGARREGPAPPRPDRRAATRVRLLQPDDARG